MFQRLHAKMMVVAAEDVQAHLPELLRLVTEGVRVVISEGGNWSAMLGPAPAPPPTPEAEASLIEKRKEVMREWVRWRLEDGPPVPEDSPVRAALDEGRAAV